MAKWLEHLTAEQNIDGSSRILGSKLGRSLIVHPAANGYLVATLGKLKAARKGSHSTSLCRRLRISVPLTGTPLTYGIVYGTRLYLLQYMENSVVYFYIYLLGDLVGSFLSRRWIQHDSALSSCIR